MVFLSNAPENRDFRVKWEVLIISMLHPSGFVKKAERAVWHCNKAVIALRRRPYCNAKAEKDSRLFYFEKKEKLKFQN